MGLGVIGEVGVMSLVGVDKGKDKDKELELEVEGSMEGMDLDLEFIIYGVPMCGVHDSSVKELLGLGMWKKVEDSSQRKERARLKYF